MTDPCAVSMGLGGFDPKIGRAKQVGRLATGEMYLQMLPLSSLFVLLFELRLDSAKVRASLPGLASQQGLLKQRWSMNLNAVTLKPPVLSETVHSVPHCGR